jgi:hypothetical protein
MRVTDLPKRSYRILYNGDLAVIRKRDIPDELEGYMQSDRDRSRFHPIIEPCKERRVVKKQSCCREVIHYYCGDKRVTYKECKQCQSK